MIKNTVHDEIDGEDSFITVSIKDLHIWAVDAMDALSDGLAWHKMNEPENSHALVMASPTECADAFIYTVLMKLAEHGAAAVDDDALDDESSAPADN